MANGNQTQANPNATIYNTSPDSPDWGQALLNYAQSGNTSQANALFGSQAGAGGTSTLAQGAGGYGTGGAAPSGPTGAQNLMSLLSAMASKQQAQAAPVNTSASGAPFTNAQNAMGRLGEAGLAAVGLGTGGQIINPTPGQIPPGSLGGVSPVASPTVSSDEPAGPTGMTTPGIFTKAPTLQPGDPSVAAATQFFVNKGGDPRVDPATALAYYRAANPAIAKTGAPTPTMPAFGAQGTAAPTPWATAPAAPGAWPAMMGQGQPGMEHPFMAAHNNALEEAGKALFTHLGGDPSTASHTDIADFHRLLTDAIGGVGGFGAVPPGVANYAAGANPPAAPVAAPSMASAGATALQTGQEPMKMQFGGLVPGRGNKDIIPAYLTPGEYVVPKSQVNQLGIPLHKATGGPAPIRMQGGGLVPDDQNEPRETRRRRLVTPSGGSQPAAQDQPQQEPQQQSSQQPAAGSQIDWNAIAQARAARAGGASGTPYYSQGGGAWVGASPGTGQSGYAYANPAAAAADPGATGKGAIGMSPNMGAAAGAIGGLASGLASAAKAYADSIKPWQMQSSKIPAPPSPPPTTQLAQAQVPQPRQQQQQNQMNAAYYGNYFPYMS